MAQYGARCMLLSPYLLHQHHSFAEYSREIPLAALPYDTPGRSRPEV